MLENLTPYHREGEHATLSAINSAAMTTKAYGGKETLGNHLDKWHISSQAPYGIHEWSWISLFLLLCICI